MTPWTVLNSISGQEEVIKLFIVTDGAECVVPSAHLEEPAESLPEGPLHDQVTCHGR